MDNPSTKQQPSPAPKLLSVPQTGTVLGVGARSVWRLIGEGQLPKVRVGRSVRIPVEAIDEFIRRGGTAR